jgi:uncharacterized protein (TIGR02145 family)
VNVAYGVSSISVTGTATNSKATVTGNTSNYALAVGDNAIKLTVTAPNCTTQEYTVTVVRAAASSDANLKSITLSAGAGVLSPAFHADSTAYTVNVGYSVSSISVTGAANHSAATVVGNVTDTALAVGNNTIKVTVTAEDGTTTKTYTVTVIRNAYSSTTATDVDGNTYQIKVYDGVEWMIDNSQKTSGITPTCNWPPLDQTTQAYNYGYFYSWNCAASACPAGWILPTEADFNALIAALNAGSAADQAAAWADWNTGSSLAGAGNSGNDNGGRGEAGRWWSSSSTNWRWIVYNGGRSGGFAVGNNNNMLNVRCRRGSNDANLSAITLSAGAGVLSPAFHADSTAYTVNVGYSVSSITVTGTKNHSGASVADDGIKTLSEGINTIPITVTAQDATTTKIYTVTVVRNAYSSTTVTDGSNTYQTKVYDGVEWMIENATKAGVTGCSPASADGGSYGYRYPWSCAASACPAGWILPSAEDFTNLYSALDAAADKAAAWADWNTGFSLAWDGFLDRLGCWKVGTANNYYARTDNGKTLGYVYTGNVSSSLMSVRCRRLSSDATLSGITLNKGVLAPSPFHPDSTAYTVNVADTVSTISVTGVKNYSAATVAGNVTNKALVVGNNVVTITVTAEDGTTKIIYTVTVVRVATSTYTANGVSFEMVPISGGTTNLPTQADGTGTAVTLNSFNIGKYEVTQGLWEAVMGTTYPGPNAPDTIPGLGPNFPVYYISWTDIVGTSGGVGYTVKTISYYTNGFCYKLSQLVGGGKQFRLPTEAEWEYAAKGGQLTHNYTYSGSDSIDSVAWYVVNAGGTSHEVGTKAANELGIYDMSGNVFEWCSDWYNASYPFSTDNPTGAGSGSYRMTHSGAYSHAATTSRIVNRGYSTNSVRNGNLGFRIVLP